LKQLRVSSILMSIIFVILTNGSAQTAPRRVIIDTDPGVDDAMAILLALNSPELKVEALTVVPGNVEAAQGLENALKLVSLGGRCDVLVGGRSPAPVESKADHGSVLAR
jgi:purine nucleosidase